MDDRPIDDTCECKVCLNFSRGYIHHLFRAQEMLGMQLLTIHNVFFMNRLLKAVRKAIKSGTLRVERKKWTRL